MIATRFTSSTTPSGSLTSLNYSASYITNPKSASGNPADAAARMSMYGPITRQTIEFVPSKLLCKRFNVRAPSSTNHVGKPDYNVPAKPQELVPQAHLAQMSQEVTSPVTFGKAGGAIAEAPVINTERNDALEAEKAAADVFHAIFGSDGEEDG